MLTHEWLALVSLPSHHRSFSPPSLHLYRFEVEMWFACFIASARHTSLQCPAISRLYQIPSLAMHLSLVQSPSIPSLIHTTVTHFSLLFPPCCLDSNICSNNNQRKF